MPAQIPTTSEIRTQIISYIETRLGQTVPLLPKAFIRVLAGALAGILTLVYRFGLWLLNQIFPQTSDSPQLEKQGELAKNLLRTPASSAIIECTATGTNGTLIATGTQYRGPNGLVYVAQTDETIAGGVATLSVLSLTAGSAGNLLVSDTLTIISPIAGADNTITVVTVTTEGEEQESIDDYRDRVVFAYKRPAQGGSLPDFIGWQLEVPDVTRAFAFRTNDYEVTGYPLTDNDPGGRIPSGAKLAEVLSYLEDPSRKPFGADVLTAAMSEVTVNVTITSFLPNEATTITNAENALIEFIEGRQPQQFSDEVPRKDFITRSELEAVAISVGAISLTLVFNIGAGTIESYQLDSDELATDGVISIST